MMLTNRPGYLSRDQLAHALVKGLIGGLFAPVLLVRLTRASAVLTPSVEALVVAFELPRRQLLVWRCRFT